MILINRFIKLLNDADKKYLEFYFKNFSLKQERTKQYKMLELLFSNGFSDEKTLIKALYGESYNLSTYSRTKKRLYETLRQFIISRNIKNYLQNERQIEHIEVLQDYLLAQALLSHRDNETAFNILNKALNKCKKNEFIQEAIIIQNTLALQNANKKGINAYDKIYEDINEDISELIKLNASKNYYTNLGISKKIVKSENVINKRFKEVVESEKELLKKINITNYKYSVTMLQDLRLQLYKYKAEADYTNAISTAFEILKLIDDNRKKYPAVENAITYAEMSEAYYGLQDTKNAIDYAEKAIKIFSYNSFNSYELVANKINIAIYNKEYNHLNKYIEELQMIKDVNKSKEHSARIKYYKAVDYFFQNQHSKANQYIREARILEKDKVGWLMSFRLVENMILIKEKDFKSLEFQLRYFAPMIKKLKHEKLTRMQEIVKLLSAIYAVNGDIEELHKKYGAIVRNVKSNKGKYRWDPLGYETIRFDTWLDENYFNNPS